ncbi:MAG: hypothetical protein ACXWL5_04070 [Candidatus Chromulinivorax sp.]
MNCRLLLSSLLLMSSFFLESSMDMGFINDSNFPVSISYSGNKTSTQYYSLLSNKNETKPSYRVWQNLAHQGNLIGDDRIFRHFEETFEYYFIGNEEDYVRKILEPRTRALHQVAANREQNNQTAKVPLVAQQQISAPVVQVAPVVNQANSNCSWCPRLFPRRPQVHPEQANH